MTCWRWHVARAAEDAADRLVDLWMWGLIRDERPFDLALAALWMLITAPLLVLAAGAYLVATVLGTD